MDGVRCGGLFVALYLPGQRVKLRHDEEDYPILKGKLEKIKKRSLEYLSKFSIFNLAMILNYLVIIYLFGIQDILEDVGPLGKFSVVLLLLMGNVVFFVYDIALSRIITAYRMVLRKKIFRRIGQG